MNAADVLADGVARLMGAGVENARLDARVLLAHILKKNPSELIGRFEIAAAEVATFVEAIARRVGGSPVAYITGHKQFWSLDFEVGPGVLIPRPETETLIEQALLEFPDRSAPLAAVDFGTGSACIPLAFLSEFQNASAIGIERSPEAMAFAQRNKARFTPGSRLTLQETDWASKSEQQFDIVFSNPPYLTRRELGVVAPEVRQEPEDALLAGADGLDAYRSLTTIMPSRLKAGGRVFLEIGAGQAEAVCDVLASGGLETMRIASDLSGIPRCIVARPKKSSWNKRS